MGMLSSDDDWILLKIKPIEISIQPYPSDVLVRLMVD
jgi:hypothetical protein